MRLRGTSTTFGLAVAVLGAFVVAASAATPTPGKVTKSSFKYGERTIDYYLFVPKGVSAPASAPLLVLLHGSGRNGATLVEPWKKLAEKEGIVLLGPDAKDPRGWYVPTDGPAALCDLVDDVRRSVTAVDARRIYLFGHSAGAVFVLYMSLLEPEYFAASALHAGAFRSPEEFAGIQPPSRNIPIAMTVGDSDRFFAVADVSRTADALKKVGFPVQLEIRKRHDHNYYVVSDEVNAWAWAALSAHSLDADPAFKVWQFR